MTSGGPPGDDDPPPRRTQPDPAPRAGPATIDERAEPEAEPPALYLVFPTLRVLEQDRLQGGQARGLYRCAVDGDSTPTDWPREVFVKVYRAAPRHERIWQAWRTAAREAGITRLLDARLVDGWAYEVTPYHVRGSLSDRLAKRPKLPLALAEVERIVGQVARALTVLHELRIEDLRVVHRDIKPANLLMVDLDEPTVEITDFGVARLQQPPADRAPFVGSYEYAPPEALGADTVAQGWDWWSLGITILELIQGHHPLDYGHRFERADFTAAILNGSVPIPDTLPARWWDLVRGLLSTADLRWSGAEVLAWLAGVEVPVEDTAAGPSKEAPEAAEAGRPEEAAWRESRPAFPYADGIYDDPVALANALSADWSAAVRSVIAGVRWVDLQSWATAWRAELGTAVDEVYRGFVLPRRHPDRSLSELLVRLDPTLAPRFLGHPVDRIGLNQLAAGALGGSAEALDAIEQLRVSGSLLAFAVLPEQAGLAAMDETWQRWFAAARRAIERARPLAAGLDLDAELAGGELAALLLQCAVSSTARDTTAELARAALDRPSRRIPWVAELLLPESRYDRPARDALIVLLAPLAYDPDAGRAWHGRPRRTGLRHEPVGAPPDQGPLPGVVPLPTSGAPFGLSPVPTLTAVPAPRPTPAPPQLPTPKVLPVPSPLPAPALLSAPEPLPLPLPRSRHRRTRSRS